MVPASWRGGQLYDPHGRFLTLPEAVAREHRSYYAKDLFWGVVFRALERRRVRSKPVADAVTDSELGRSKKMSSPAEHLQHLLNIGWPSNAPLVQKYALKYRLQAQLAEWDAAKPAAAKTSGRSR